MIERLKAFWKWYIGFSDRFEDWRNEHKAWMRIGFGGTFLVVTIVVLGYGLFIRPQYSHMKDTALKQYQTWNNGNASIALTSKDYNPDTHIMVLRFSLKNGSGAVAGGDVLQNKIKFGVKVDKPSEAQFETVPTTNSDYVMVVKDLKPNFKAVHVTATNNMLTTTSMADSSSNSKSNKDISFTINYKPGVINKKLVVHSRQQYAFDDIKDANQKLKAANKKTNGLINDYKQIITNDQQVITQLNDNVQYQSGNDKETTTNKIESYNQDIQTNTTNVQDAQKKIKSRNNKIDLNLKRKSDIKSGKYKLPATKISVQKWTKK